MECLLDTNALLWIVTDDVQLSKKARKIFLDEENEIFISVASLWEIAIKVSLKRLNLGQTLNEFYIRHIVGNKIRLMDIKVEHLAELEYLEFHHRDPFDRLIISQAIVEKIHVLSKDKVLSKYRTTLKRYHACHRGPMCWEQNFLPAKGEIGKYLLRTCRKASYHRNWPDPYSMYVPWRRVLTYLHGMHIPIRPHWAIGNDDRFCCSDVQ